MLHSIALLSGWNEPEDITARAVFYWRILPEVLQLKHIDSSAQEHFITQLQKAMDSHESPWDDWRISQAAIWAIDILATDKVNLPTSLIEDILRPSELARYEVLATILRMTPSKAIEKYFSIYVAQHNRLLFEILDRYPITKVIQQLINECFDYSRTFNNFIIQEVLNRFREFRPLLFSEHEVNYWIQCLLENPEKLYHKDHQRTLLLCEWIAKDETFRFDHATVEKLYHFGNIETDSSLRCMAVRFLRPRPGCEQWLEKIYLKERSPEVQREIIVKLVELMALASIKQFIAKQDSTTQAFTLAEWLQAHPKTIHDHENDILSIVTLYVSLLGALTECLGSAFLRKLVEVVK